MTLVSRSCTGSQVSAGQVTRLASVLLGLLGMLVVTLGCRSQVGTAVPIPAEDPESVPRAAVTLAFRIGTPTAALSPRASFVVTPTGAEPVSVTVTVNSLRTGQTETPVATVTQEFSVTENAITSITIPALEVLPTYIRVRFTNGTVGGFRRFHGAADLVPGDNQVIVCPEESSFGRDVVAAVMSHLTVNPSWLAAAPAALVGTIQSFAGGVDPHAATAVQAIVARFRSQYVAAPTGPGSLTLQWKRLMGGAGYRAAATSDGGFYLLARADAAAVTEWPSAVVGEFWVLRFDAGGQIVWRSRIGGGSSDRVLGLASTPDGGVVALCRISGVATAFGFNQNGGSEFTMPLPLAGTKGGFAIDRFGGMYVTDGQYLISRYTSSGLAWSVTVRAPAPVEIQDLGLGRLGLWVGGTIMPISMDGRVGSSTTLAGYINPMSDPSLDPITAFLQSVYWHSLLAVAPDGGFWMLNVHSSENGYFLRRMLPSGAVQARLDTLPTTWVDAEDLLGVQPDGTLVYVCGADGSSSPPGFHPGATMNLQVTRIGVSGALMDTRCYGGSSSEYPLAMTMMADGGFLVVAASHSNDGDPERPLGYGGMLWLLKFR